MTDVQLQEVREEEMITSRKEAIFLIGLHMVPNIVGILRFTYGFHRTGSEEYGLKYDILLGIESVLNIVSDVVVILVLRKAVGGTDTFFGAPSPEVVTRVLAAFVAWNTVALMFCCAGNLAGLQYPPKWYTYRDVSQLTLEQKSKILIYWAPVIIFIAFWKLYYTSLLYEFYKLYKASRGRAFDTDSHLHIRFTWLRESTTNEAAASSPFDRSHQLRGRRPQRQSVAAADRITGEVASTVRLPTDFAGRQSVASDECPITWVPDGQVQRLPPAPEWHAAVHSVHLQDSTFGTRGQSAAAAERAVAGAATHTASAHHAKRLSFGIEYSGAVNTRSTAWQPNGDMRRESASAQQSTNAGVMGQRCAHSGRPPWQSAVAHDGEAPGTKAVLRPSNDQTRRPSAYANQDGVNRLITVPEARRRSLRQSIAMPDREAAATTQLPLGGQCGRHSEDREHVDGTENQRRYSGQTGQHRCFAIKRMAPGATASHQPTFDSARRWNVAGADLSSATAHPPPSSARMRRKSSGADDSVDDTMVGISRGHVPARLTHRHLAGTAADEASVAAKPVYRKTM